MTTIKEILIYHKYLRYTFCKCPLFVMCDFWCCRLWRWMNVDNVYYGSTLHVAYLTCKCIVINKMRQKGLSETLCCYSWQRTIQKTTLAWNSTSNCWFFSFSSSFFFLTKYCRITWTKLVEISEILDLFICKIETVLPNSQTGWKKTMWHDLSENSSS